MRRFMIAGTRSGCGKTTITCAILAALKKRGLRTVSFKSGPDYIDPMFHRKMIGSGAYNLDSFFCERDTLLFILDEYGAGSDIAVMEGAMGFFDGGEGSAHTLSGLTASPAVIVIDCKGMSESIGAVMNGFLSYRKSNIAGFIFNRLPESLVPQVQEECRRLGTEYFGRFPQTSITFESRHLGLVTADETDDIKDKLCRLGELAEEHLLLDRLLDTEAPELPSYTPPVIERAAVSPVIAAAEDRAFCFQYPENISLLEKLGCTVKKFSPMTDSRIPEADGLILCGGYPELYAEQLSLNVSMRESIKAAVLSGLPTIAECGGFMYLHDELTDKEGRTFPMAGVIRGRAFPTERLRRFGYITMTAAEDNILCKKGGRIRAHEFHYWDSENCGDCFTAEKRDGRSWECCHAAALLYAGFPHIYLYSSISAAESFVRSCCERKEAGK